MFWMGFNSLFDLKMVMAVYRLEHSGAAYNYSSHRFSFNMQGDVSCFILFFLSRLDTTLDTRVGQITLKEKMQLRGETLAVK